MAAEKTTKTVGMVLVICFICAVLVSTSVVLLKPKQEMNKRLEKIKNVIQVADLVDREKDIEDIFSKKISQVLIDLKTGLELSEKEYTNEINPENYDLKKIIKTPGQTVKIPRKEDLAGIIRVPRYMLLYRIKKENQVSQLVFPIYGKGLWSTLYGFLSLDFIDLNTIKGITFYEHGETPGLGGEVDNPEWKKNWQGKKIFDNTGRVKLRVAKEQGNQSSIHDIDGLSGATITSRGVENIVKFWFGDNGYGFYLNKLREKRIDG